MTKIQTNISIIWVESVYMLFEIILACASSFIQTVFCEYKGQIFGCVLFYDETTERLLNATVYYYNYYMYVLGVVVYFGISLLFYQKFFKSFLNVIIKCMPLALFLVLFGCGVMIFTNFGVFYNYVLEFPDMLKPGAFFFFTIFGWPAITALFLIIKIIKTYKLQKHM